VTRCVGDGSAEEAWYLRYARFLSRIRGNGIFLKRERYPLRHKFLTTIRDRSWSPLHKFCLCTTPFSTSFPANGLSIFLVSIRNVSLSFDEDKSRIEVFDVSYIETIQYAGTPIMVCSSPYLAVFALTGHGGKVQTPARCHAVRERLCDDPAAATCVQTRFDSHTFRAIGITIYSCRPGFWAGSA